MSIDNWHAQNCRYNPVSIFITKTIPCICIYHQCGYLEKYQLLVTRQASVLQNLLHGCYFMLNIMYL